MMIVLGLALALVAVALLAGLKLSMIALVLARPSGDRVFNLAKEVMGTENGPGASLNMLILALALVALIRRPGALAAPPVAALLAFVLAAGASAVAAPDPALAFRLLVSLATYWAALLLAHVAVDDVVTARRMVWAVIASSAPPVAVGLVEIAADPQILLGAERALGTFTHPNIFAFYLVTVLAAILFTNASAMMATPRWIARLLLVYAALLLVMILATKTRSAWGGLALLMAAQALFVDRRWLIGCLCAPGLLLLPGVSERFLDLLAGNTNDAYAQLNSLAWRQLLWSETWRWLEENPPGLLGHGLDHYIQYVPLFFERGSRPTGIGTHNAILQIWFEAGALGLAAFGVAVAALAASLARRLGGDRPGGVIMIALCLGYLLFAYSDNVLDYLQFQWTFWFLTGAVCASTRFAEGALADAPPGRGKTTDGEVGSPGFAIGRR